MKKRIIKICILVLILIFVLALYFKIYVNKSSFTNGNIANYGLVVENSNGDIYYNKYGKGIYCIKNGIEEKLTEDENVYSLNLVDDKLYYLSIEDFSKIFIKVIDVNNKSVNTICNISTPISKIFVNKKEIYYFSNKEKNGIRKFDLNNQNEQIIIDEDIKDFQVDFASKKSII